MSTLRLLGAIIGLTLLCCVGWVYVMLAFVLVGGV